MGIIQLGYKARLAPGCPYVANICTQERRGRPLETASSTLLVRKRSLPRRSKRLSKLTAELEERQSGHNHQLDTVLVIFCTWRLQETVLMLLRNGTERILDFAD